MTDEQFLKMKELMKASGRTSFAINCRLMIGLCKEQRILSVASFDSGVDPNTTYLYDQSIDKFIKERNISSNYEYFLNKTCKSEVTIPIHYKMYAKVKRMLEQYELIYSVPDMSVYEDFMEVQNGKKELGAKKIILAGYPIIWYKGIVSAKKGQTISLNMYTTSTLPYVIMEWCVDTIEYKIFTYIRVNKLCRGV